MGHDSCVYLCWKPLHSQFRYTRQCSNWCWDWQMLEIQWPTWQLLLSTSCNQNYWRVWQVYFPFFSCLAKKLVDMSGNPRVWQWLHQRLSLVKGNVASILAGVQVWSDFNHLLCIKQRSCPSFAFLRWIAVAFQLLAFSMSLIVFGLFLCFL